jgi:hypothetical protein
LIVAFEHIPFLPLRELRTIAWYSDGPVTSTFIIGSRMDCSAELNPALKEYLVAIPKAKEEESTE